MWTKGTNEGRGRRVLVLADATIEPRACAALAACLGRGTDVLLVSPALNGRLRHWLSDEDRAREAAEDRLAASLASLASAGIRARGWVGDADPRQAVADALPMFRPDEIVVAANPPERANWLERRLRDRELFGIPLRRLAPADEREGRAERALVLAAA